MKINLMADFDMTRPERVWLVGRESTPALCWSSPVFTNTNYIHPNPSIHKMARTSTLSAAAKPTGVNRKAKQKAAREKKRQRTSSGGSSRRQSRQAPAEEDEGEEEAGDGTTQDIEDMEEEHGHTRPNRRPFVYLKARERKIPQDKITSEWKSLADPSLEKVRGLLTAAKRSVASGARSKKAALMADQAVEALMGQLLMRLPRMPFPPKTNEKAFDLEKSLEQNVGEIHAICNPILIETASIGERNDRNDTFN